MTNKAVIYQYFSEDQQKDKFGILTDGKTTIHMVFAPRFLHAESM